MTKKKQPKQPTVNLPTVPEMNLRDFFAAQALIGIIANQMTNESPTADAVLAYKYADAMLRARA